MLTQTASLCLSHLLLSLMNSFCNLSAPSCSRFSKVSRPNKPSVRMLRRFSIRVKWTSVIIPRSLQTCCIWDSRLIRVYLHVPELMFHNRTALIPALASVCPLGLNATLLTRLLSPVKVSLCLPETTSHNFTSETPTLASVYPSGLNAISAKASPECLRMCLHSPQVKLHNKTSPEAALASVRPLGLNATLSMGPVSLLKVSLCLPETTSHNRTPSKPSALASV